MSHHVRLCARRPVAACNFLIFFVRSIIGRRTAEPLLAGHVDSAALENAAEACGHALGREGWRA